MSKRYIRKDQVSKILKIDLAELDNFIETHKIPHILIGNMLVFEIEFLLNNFS